MTVAVALERRRLAGRTKKSAMVLGPVGGDGGGAMGLWNLLGRRKEGEEGDEMGGGNFGRARAAVGFLGATAAAAAWWIPRRNRPYSLP
jgi:hypothetical protein